MEQKLDGLVALLTSGTDVGYEGQAAQLLTPQPEQSQEASQAESQAAFDFADFSRPVSPLPSNMCTRLMSYQSLSVFSFPSLAIDGPQDPISKGILRFDQAAESLQLFRSQNASFPFIVVPSHLSIDMLRRERPFLLLTILLLGSHKNAEMLPALHHDVKETISQKMIIEGEKSIDLLQGLLVYLCWYVLPFIRDVLWACQKLTSRQVSFLLYAFDGTVLSDLADDSNSSC